MINHGPYPESLSARKIRDEIKNVAPVSTSSTRELIRSNLTTATTETIARVGSKHSLRMLIYRSRAKLNYFPRTPRTASEIVIPEELRVTLNNERFLLRDSRDESNRRILIFGTETNLSKLGMCLNWLCDGTFKVSPSQFYQLYTVHGFIEGYAIPLIYILLERKDQETYRAMWQAIKEMKPDLNPQKIFFDFEKAAQNAACENFSLASICGCYFHLGQSVWRKINQIGLRDGYINDSNIRKYCKMLMSLGFVPESDVVSAFVSLQNSENYSSNLDGLFDYFEDNFIGTLRAGGRRNGIFPIKTCNVYQSTIDGEPRTTNSVEGWHLSFSQSIGSTHPNIFKFIEYLKKEQQLQEQNIQYISIGDIPTYAKSKKLLEREARIKRIVQNYTTRPILEYLNGIADNLEININ